MKTDTEKMDVYFYFIINLKINNFNYCSFIDKN
jgi:hypothetical protein